VGKLDDRDVKKAVRMYKKGHSCADIGKSFEVTDTTIWLRIKDLVEMRPNSAPHNIESLKKNPIRDFLEERGIKQEILADEIEMSPMAINSIITGRSTNVRLATLIKIKESIGCSYDELIEYLRKFLDEKVKKSA